MDCVKTNVAKRPGDIGELARRLETIHYSLTHSRAAGPKGPAPHMMTQDGPQAQRAVVA